jgi:hypothetical protein
MKHSFGARSRHDVASDTLRHALPLCMLTAMLVALLWGSGLAASEVYTWTDEDGVVHYSQTPRAQGKARVIEAGEAYKPGTVDIAPPVDKSRAGPETSGAQPLTTAEARRQKLDQQRQARREQQEQSEHMCSLHRQRLEQMEPARRVFYTDESGETVRMDDDLRIGLIEESKAFLADNCDD